MRRSSRWMWLAAFAAAFAWGHAKPEPVWTLLRSEHFELYSQSDPQAARAALLWFEQLRRFFERSVFPPIDRSSQVRVIGFKSPRQYDAYGLRPGADAYYVGIDTRDYIVLPSLGSAELVTAAHEYAHLQLHANGLNWPLWLSEGVAEFFSTVRIAQSECYLGGELPARVSTLRHSSLMPLRELVQVIPGGPIQTNRRTAPLFYAESWALAEMLILSPDYGPRFRDLVTSVSSGTPSADALTRIYGKSLDEIMADLRTWIEGQKFRAVRLPGITTASVRVEARRLSQIESSLMLGDLAATSDRLDRAERLYRQVAQTAPNNAEAWAALGSIALRKGSSDLARQNWKRAIDNGIKDAQLCYRYATLADNAGLDANEIRPALRRAIELEPDFDDARYKLALLESNAGRFDEAVTQLHAMRNVATARAFSYWAALSYACDEVGRREDAQRAAGKAFQYASTSDERERARQLAYMANTDPAVQFARDKNGQPQLMTARVPHNSANWNPFIEPGDRMQRVEGQLTAITCSAGKATGVVIESMNHSFQITISDPTELQIRNAPPEFTCGPQTGKSVSADYAAYTDAVDGKAGVLRGLDFH